MTNSYFRRPRTEQVRGPGRVERPNSVRGADRVRVSRGRDGAFKDWSNAQVAGQNAGLQFQEISNFLGQVTETAIPAAKDLMQDWGVTEAKGLLADPGFMESLRSKGGEGRVLYDKLNPFGQEYADAALAEGVVAGYAQGLEPALLQDDALLTFPDNDAAAAAQRDLRIQRLDQLKTDVGYDALPPNAQALAMQKIAGMEQKATQILRGQQMAGQVQAKDAKDATAVANIFVIEDNNDTIKDATDSGSMIVTPEQQQAIDAESANKVQNARTQLANIIGPARNARSAAELIAQAAEQLSGMDNGAQRIALLEQAVATMEFDNQALNNVIIGKSGQSLRNVLESERRAALQVEDEDEKRELGEIAGKTALQMIGIAENPNLSDAEKLEQLNLKNAEFLAQSVVGGYDNDQIQQASSTLADIAARAGLPIAAASQKQLADLMYQMNGGKLTEEQANEIANGIVDPQVRVTALQAVKQFSDNAVDPNSASNNNSTRRSANNNRIEQGAIAIDKAFKENPDLKGYENSGLTANGQGDNWKKRITNRAETNYQQRVDDNANSEKPEKLTPELLDGWYREEVDKAIEYFLSDTNVESTWKDIQLETTEQAQTWNEEIGDNLKDAPPGRPDVSIFPDALVELYQTQNKGKPLSYDNVSKWYSKYLGGLDNPDGSPAFPEPRKTWRELLQNRPAQPGLQNDAFNPASGPIGAPIGLTPGLGMIDPSRYQAGFQRLKELFGFDVTGQEQSPAKEGESKPKARYDEATSTALLAISALTGNATAYPTMQVTDSGQGNAGPLDYMIQSEGMPAFNALWNKNEPYRPNTPALPQVAAAKPVPSSPPTMLSINHPHAVLIGVNEGTRTAGGGFTNAYTSHSDPLSGMNQGNFSAQQGYSSPRAADRAWLSKLNNASFGMFQPALKAAGLQPGTAGWERLLFNLRDAYVQAPASVTDPGGLISRIPEIIDGGVTVEAIARARANSYINPRTGRLDTNFRSYAALLKDQRSRSGTWDYKRRLGN